MISGLRHSLTDAVKEFLQAGGHYLFWMRSISIRAGWKRVSLLDANPALKIVFATTFVLADRGAERVKGMRLFYTMHPMLFREFLSYESILDKDPIPLEDILANHHDSGEGRSMQGDEYCADLPELSGTWMLSFYWQDPDMYYFRLQELVRKDLPGFCTWWFLYFDE